MDNWYLQDLHRAVGTLRGLMMLYHHAHANAAGATYYGDHLLLQRLYEGDGNAAPIDDIDALMERMKGLRPDVPLDPAVTLGFMAETVQAYQDAADGDAVSWQAFLELEAEVQKLLTDLIHHAEAGAVPIPAVQGLVNLLAGILDRRQTTIYLLQQRAAAPYPQASVGQTGRRTERRAIPRR